ncbi:MAG: DNA repair protein RecN [Acidimicrobiales bacterium]
MLIELRVRDLGVIEDTALDIGDGMTALTGETGAGKTLVVEALELLVGGRADPMLVRSGAREALVEGRFSNAEVDLDAEGQPVEDQVDDENVGETVLARALPASGRSRAWVDGRMATATALSEVGSRLVDLHGQHSHQSLLDPVSQRSALDTFAGVDLGPLSVARNTVRALAAEMKSLGGDEAERAREIDLLRHQVSEIESACISSPSEDETLCAEEARLSGAAALREAAGTALADLDSETGGALDGIGRAVAHLEGHDQLGELRDRARGLQAEVADLSSELRIVTETWEDDPERLAAVSARRARLADLRRKYGSTLEEVAKYGADARRRLNDLESADERSADLALRIAEARANLTSVEATIGAARRRAAPRLAKAVETHLRNLAMPAARLEVVFDDDAAGDDVMFLLGANPGEPSLPLGKVASGGELARAMLALRLVVAGGRPTLVFDEVDAGIGGAAAEAVGRALAELSAHHQVLVVTHLPQVAAFAHHQFVVEKQVHHGRTTAVVRPLGHEERVVELARMLSGRPASASARHHAEELLADAAKIRVAPAAMD